MKKLTLALCFIMVCSVAMAQKPILKPETVVSMQSNDHSRTLTGADLHRELGQYKVDKKVTHGAYQAISRNAKRLFVVPMAPEIRNRLDAQRAMFEQTAVTAVPRTMTRGTEQTLEFAYNQQWGNQGTFAAYIDALAKVYGSADARSIHAHLNAGGYVFDYDVKALEFSVDMTNNGGSPSALTTLRVFGETKFSSTTPLIYTTQFFNGELSKSVDFFIGPVPVSVRGSIGGQAGFEAKLSVVGNGIQGSVTPNITSYGKADAGVDLWFVKAGVEGQLVLLNDSLPIALTTQLFNDNGLKLDIALKAENHLSALRGKVDVFVDVLDLWEDEWERYSMNLFAWDGIQKDWVLYDQSYKLPLN